MEIRANKDDYKLFVRIGAPVGVPITKENQINESVIMIHQGGKLIPWLAGRKAIKGYLKYGYNRIIKNCPHRSGQCIGERCSFYVIQNGTGDCAHVWNAIQAGRALSGSSNG